MRTIMMAACASLVGVAAQAAVVSATGPVTIASAAGLDLRANVTQSPNVQAYNEKTSVTVGAGALDVNYLVGTNGFAVGGSVPGDPAGTIGLTAGLYDSHLIRFDRDGAGTVGATTITFSDRIVGLSLNNGPLNASDALFGNAAFYANGDGTRRYESSEGVTLISATTISIAGLGVNDVGIDEMRVFTEAAALRASATVPLPASGLLLPVAVGALVQARRRARQPRVA